MDDAGVKQEFLSYFQTSGLPSQDKWPEGSPVFLAASQRAPNINYDLPPQESHSLSPFPLDGTVVSFEGPLFKGKVVSRVKSNSNPNNSSRGNSYFKGKSRLFQWTVQGTFKQRIRFDKLITGQEFERPFRNMPSAKLVKKGIDLLKNRLPNTFECDLFAQKPRFEHPLICGCQGFRIDEGHADLHAPHQLIGEDEHGQIIENTQILGKEVPKSSERRRNYFSKLENLKKYYFEPATYIYTFEFYSNWFSPMRHRIEIAPLFSFDLVQYFNGCPLFFAMAKDKDSGEYLFATEIWHRRLLDYEEKTSTTKRFSFKRRSNQNKLDHDIDQGRSMSTTT